MKNLKDSIILNTIQPFNKVGQIRSEIEKLSGRNFGVISK